MSQGEWQALQELRQVLGSDEEFRVEWWGSAVALVRHGPMGQDRYIASVAELEEWRQALHKVTDGECDRGYPP